MLKTTVTSIKQAQTMEITSKSRQSNTENACGRVGLDSVLENKEGDYFNLTIEQCIKLRDLDDYSHFLDVSTSDGCRPPMGLCAISTLVPVLGSFYTAYLVIGHTSRVLRFPTHIKKRSVTKIVSIQLISFLCAFLPIFGTAYFHFIKPNEKIVIILEDVVERNIYIPFFLPKNNQPLLGRCNTHLKRLKNNAKARFKSILSCSKNKLAKIKEKSRGFMGMFKKKPEDSSQHTLNMHTTHESYPQSKHNHDSNDSNENSDNNGSCCTINSKDSDTSQKYKRPLSTIPEEDGGVYNLKGLGYSEPDGIDDVFDSTLTRRLNLFETTYGKKMNAV